MPVNYSSDLTSNPIQLNPQKPEYKHSKAFSYTKLKFQKKKKKEQQALT